MNRKDVSILVAITASAFDGLTVSTVVYKVDDDFMLEESVGKSCK